MRNLLSKVIQYNRVKARKQKPTFSVASAKKNFSIIPIPEVSRLIARNHLPKEGYSSVFWQRKELWPFFKTRILIPSSIQNHDVFHGTFVPGRIYILSRSLFRIHEKQRNLATLALLRRIYRKDTILQRFKNHYISRTWYHNLVTKINANRHSKKGRRKYNVRLLRKVIAIKKKRSIT